MPVFKYPLVLFRLITEHWSGGTVDTWLSYAYGFISVHHGRSGHVIVIYCLWSHTLKVCHVYDICKIPWDFRVFVKGSMTSWKGLGFKWKQVWVEFTGQLFTVITAHTQNPLGTLEKSAEDSNDGDFYHGNSSGGYASVQVLAKWTAMLLCRSNSFRLGLHMTNSWSILSRYAQRMAVPLIRKAANQLKDGSVF